jgi:hypothetical protein
MFTCCTVAYIFECDDTAIHKNEQIANNYIIAHYDRSCSEVSLRMLSTIETPVSIKVSFVLKNYHIAGTS